MRINADGHERPLRKTSTPQPERSLQYSTQVEAVKPFPAQSNGRLEGSSEAGRHKILAHSKASS
jgi:hypothetical protein